MEPAHTQKSHRAMANLASYRELYPTNYLSMTERTATLPASKPHPHLTHSHLFSDLPPELRVEI